MNAVDTTEKQENSVALTEVPVQQAEKIEYKKKPVYDFLKRGFDIVCSLAALVVLSPVFLITSIAIVIDDFGNPFFVQERVGFNNKLFRMIKFRSMCLNADEKKAALEEKNEYDSVHFKITDDPRITKVGKVIRRTSIDELPQLINVLKGDMSIIGPRPFIQSEQEQLPAERLKVKPGLSCYWQIEKTQNMPIEEQLELDYKYISERSFATDLKIIFRTIAVVFRMGND